MITSPAFASRRKPGAEENPYLPFGQPAAKGKADTPLARRKQLLRRLRADPDLTCVGYRVLETKLDRVPSCSTNLVTWDSNESAAARAGISPRTLNFTLADLVEGGMILRLSPVQFRAWLAAGGEQFGFRYPEGARQPRRFTVMLVQLSTEDSKRVRSIAQDILFHTGPTRNICLQEPASDRAKSAFEEGNICAQDPPDLARVPPIVEFGSSEFEPLNRKGDGSLDPREKKTGTGTPAEDDRERIELEQLAAGPDPIAARLARASLNRLTSSAALKLAERGVDTLASLRPPPTPPAPLPAPAPASLDAAAQVRAMRSHLASSAAVPAALGEPASSPIHPGSRIWEQVHTLPDASPARVDAVVRALQGRFRDWNEVTHSTWLKYFGLVSRREFPAELVAGLVKDACEPGVKKPGRHLSKALADEWQRMKDRSSGVSGNSPDDRR
jgi:hypothetical protein